MDAQDLLQKRESARNVLTTILSHLQRVLKGGKRRA